MFANISWPSFNSFLCMLLVAVAPTFSGGVGIHCTSGFLDDVMISYNCPHGGVKIPQQRRYNVMHANTPAARKWLRPVLDDGRRKD